MNEKEYIEEKTVSIKFANLIALLVMILTGILTISIIISWKINWTKRYFIVNIINIKSVIAYIMVFISIFLHEYIHAMMFKIFLKQKNFFEKEEHVKIGFDKRSMTPYCYCDEKLRLWQYIIAIMAPGFILGIIPYVISVLYRDIIWLFFSWICFSSAGADFYIILIAVRFGKFNTWVIDHPEKVGFYVCKNNEL